MRCENCQAELAPEAQFCPSCGAFVRQAAAAPQRFEYVRPPSAPAGMPGVPAVPIAQPAWVTLLISVLAGLLVGYLGLLRMIMDFTYGMYVRTLIWLPISLVVLVGMLMLLIPLSKGAGSRGRLIIGLGMAVLGLGVHIIAFWWIWILVGMVLVLVGLTFILSALGKWGAPRYWLYPIGAAAGGLLLMAIRWPVLEYFGSHMISVFALGLVLVLGIVTAIFAKQEPVTGKSFSAGQMASIVGTFVAVFVLTSLL